MAEEGVAPANHCRSASFWGCQVAPLRAIGNTALGSPSITSPSSRLSWQRPLGDIHQGVVLFTKGSLKVSDSSWLSAVTSLKPPPKRPEEIQLEKFKT